MTIVYVERKQVVGELQPPIECVGEALLVLRGGKME
jgi:hypothetical protein